MGMKYHAGEKLRLTVRAYNPPSPYTVPAFGSSKITVPKEGYTYEPGTKTEMKTVGGLDGKDYVKKAVTPPKTRNKGRHILHLGGRYESYLQVPVVPEK
jgi:predicted acyl esterase